MELKRVVVSGIGTLTPLGNSLKEYWNGLLNGVSGADFITQFDAAKFKTRFACELKNFDPLNYLDKKEARKIDRFSQIAVIASDQAVEDASQHAADRHPEVKLRQVLRAGAVLRQLAVTDHRGREES